MNSTVTFIVQCQTTTYLTAHSMTDTPLKILYQDNDLVAVHKPEGLLVHKSNIDKYETQFLLQILRDQIGKHLYPVHRLDKPTSGVIVFGLSSASAANIQAQMESNKAKKDYLLVCRGYCPESGRIDHSLKPIDDFKSKRDKPKQEKPAQDAITEFKRLDTIELDVEVDRYPASRYSFVLAGLLTGRKHQIRRHFKHISHPIIGCPKYGKSTHNRYFANELDAPRLLLHSYRMTLDHPVSGQALNICSEPSGKFKDLLERFDWQLP